MKTYPRLWLWFALGALLLIGAALSSCAPDTSAPELQVPTQSTQAAPQEVTPEATAEPTQASAASVAFTDQSCLNCHTNEGVLRGMVSQAEAPATTTTASGMEPWQRLYIDAEAYASDAHYLINCTACHGGKAVGSMEAHEGLVVDPSENPEASCGGCHTDIVPFAAESLHFTVRGFQTALHERSSEAHYPALDEMQAQQCSQCHATCGDCHVSLPQIAGGGLIAGHDFLREPPAEQTCTACHGDRVGSEYEGLNEGVPADVHFAQAGMACTDCHTGAQMHGTGEFADKAHRYDGEPSPACVDCHADEVGIGSGNLLHELHGTEIASCQMCHSVAYPTCQSCHIETPDENVPFESVEAHQTLFLIGRNPLISNDRPWRYVPVQPAPIAPDSFAAYGEDLLDNFLNRPTWVYASPHNIQLRTPQTASCVSCHGNDAIFLTADKVDPAQRGGANSLVIVNRVPPFPEYATELIRQATERINRALGINPPPPPAPTAIPTEVPEVVESTAAPAPTAQPTEAAAPTPTATAEPTEESAAPEAGVTSYWESQGAPAEATEVAPTEPAPTEIAPTAVPQPTATAPAEPAAQTGDGGDFSWWANH